MLVIQTASTAGAGYMHCVKSFFSLNIKRNILLAQIETICFLSPRVSALSPGMEDDVFSFVFLFRTGICAQSEN